MLKSLGWPQICSTTPASSGVIHMYHDPQPSFISSPRGRTDKPHSLVCEQAILDPGSDYFGTSVCITCPQQHGKCPSLLLGALG